MVRIGTCPVCMQPVSIPPELAQECLVRCPTCEAEYRLEAVSGETEHNEPPEPGSPLHLLQQEAYGRQEPPLPPELIPVAGPTEEIEQDSSVTEPSLGVAEEEGPAAKEALSVSKAETELLLGESQQEPVAEAISALQVPEEPSPMPESISLPSAEDVLSASEESQSQQRQTEQLLDDGAQEVSLPEAEPSLQPLAPELSEETLLPREQAPVSSPEAISEAETPLGDQPPESAELCAIAAEEIPVYQPAPAEAASQEEPAEEVPPLDLDPLVRAPFSPEAFPLSQLIVDATGEPIGPVAAGMIVRYGLLRPLSEEEAAAMAPPQAAEPEAAIDTFDFSQLATAAAEGTAGVPISARPRKRAEVSPIKELIGIVLGGLMGLLIGYYLLNIFWGQRYNFLKIYLPGVKHTYKYAPAWVPPWLKGADSTTQAEPENIPPESPQNNKNTKGQTGPKAKLPPAGSSPAGPPAAGAPVGEKRQEGNQPASSPSVGPSDKPPASKPKQKPSAKSASAPNPAKFQVLDAPSYSSKDIAQAIQEVQEVFGCQQCNSTGQQTKTVTELQQVDGQPKEVSRQITTLCEACKGNPPKAITEEAFDRFCRLAEVLCFQTGPDNQTVQEGRLTVRNLLQRAAEEPANLEKIGPRAASRWNDAARLSMGLLAAGTLGSSKPLGPWRLYELQLAGIDQKVPLLLSTAPPAQSEDRVLVLGAIVEDPATTLEGYSGTQPALLLGAEIVRVP